MAIDNNQSNDDDKDDDDDSHTTLGGNSESLLAPTPPPKEQSPLQSPATQTLNTLSQSHLLVPQGSHNSDVGSNIDCRKRIKLASDPAKTASPRSKYCLPWKTRTERRTQQRLVESEAIAARNAADSGRGDSEMTVAINELPSTQRLQDLLTGKKGHEDESCLGHSAESGGTAGIPSLALGAKPPIDGVEDSIFPQHIFTPGAIHLPTPTPIDITSPDAMPIHTIWTTQQEGHLQNVLKSLPVRNVAFHQPGPLGLTVLKCRLGKHDYCLVPKLDHMDSNGEVISQTSTSAGELLLFPSNQFIHYENLDTLRREETRPMMVGLARLPPMEEFETLCSATVTTAATAAAAMVTLSTLPDVLEIEPAHGHAPLTVTRAAATHLAHNSSADSSDNASPNKAMAISQVLFQAIEMLRKPSSPEHCEIGTTNPSAETSRPATRDREESSPSLPLSYPQGDAHRRRSLRQPMRAPSSQSVGSVSSTARKTIRRKKPQASRLKSSHVELGTPAHPETKLEADNTLSRLVEYCDSCQSGDHKSNVDHHFRCPKNPSFDEGRYRRVVEGCKRGCKSCMTEMRKGHTKRKHVVCDLKENNGNETEKPIQALPLCRACLAKKGIHHHLCPQHDQFGTSAAAKKLDLKLVGVNIGCHPCQSECETGTASKQSHEKKCERRCQRDLPKQQSNDRQPISVRSRPSKRSAAASKPSQEPDTFHHEKSIETVARSASKRRRPPQESPRPALEEVPEKVLQQFCNSCQRQKGSHHALCPRHSSFETSGAREQLQLILAGVEAGCESCQRDYSNGGRPSSSRHHVDCPRYGRLGRRKRKYPSEVHIVTSTQHSAGDRMNESDDSRANKNMRKRSSMTKPADPSRVVSEENESSNQISKCVQRSKPSTADQKIESTSPHLRKRQKRATQKEPATAVVPVNVKEKALTTPTITGAKTLKRHKEALQSGIEPQQAKDRRESRTIAASVSHPRTTRSAKGNATEGHRVSPTGSNERHRNTVYVLDTKRACVDNAGPPTSTELQTTKTATDGSTKGEMDLKKAVQRNAADDATCTPGIPACMPFVHAKSMTIEKPRGIDAAVQDEEHRSRLDARQKFLDGVVIIDNVIVPFCHACTDSLEVHHSLCPKHPLFAKSGALEKLERIRSGVKIGCAYCTTQYETGASGKDNVQHSIQCKRMEKERRRMANNDSAKPGEIAERHFCEDGETCITMNALDDRTPSAVAKTNLKRRAKPSVVTPGVVDFAKDSPKMRLDGCITFARPTWKSCENPWGKVEYEDGDVVVLGDGGFTHHEVLAPGKRFVIDPFRVESGYNETHFSPGEGVHLLKLSRDALANISWGFTVEHHDFGGACLINSIDQNSPASVATYVGGSCRSPLCMHDMILTVNGDDVGGMTEAGFELAVETSGVQVILGVSRYRFPTLVDRLNADLENETWVALDRTLDDKRNLGWSELDLARNGVGIDTESFRRLESTFRFQDMTVTTDNSSPLDSCPPFEDRNLSPATEQQGEINFESIQQILPMPKAANDSMRMSIDSNHEINVDDASNDASLQSEDWENDDNPWVGCVCGKIHNAPSIVFWIQCEACDTWCNVAPSCVGFDEDEAKLKTWTCRACPSAHHNLMVPAR